MVNENYFSNEYRSESTSAIATKNYTIENIKTLSKNLQENYLSIHQSGLSKNVAKAQVYHSY
jgi:hypothetical protein